MNDPKIIGKAGNQVNLSAHQKNAIYQKAQEMKEQIRGSLCTREELNKPTDRNVNKMIHSEMANTKKVELFKKHMQAIGADPRDYSVERLRRR